MIKKTIETLVTPVPRPKGSKNQDHAAKRSQILAKLWPRLTTAGAMHASLRDLASAAGIGLATLKHYFGKREDVIAAALAYQQEEGAEPLKILATPSGPFAQSVRDALEHVQAGFDHGDVGGILAVGFVEGLRHPTLGPAFVACGLEPMIQAATARLQVHQKRGEMRGDVDARVGAIALVSPLILALMHQQELDGAKDYPLAVDSLIEQHAATFVRAYGC